MSDFSDYSYLTPPTDPVEFDAWFQDQEERIASKTRSALTRIIVEATEQFINSLTATGDMSYFDQIPAKWTNFVDTELVDDMQGLFLSGGMGAFSTSKSSGLFTEQLANGWVSVVNQQSVDYALEASNRMKDVGKTAWNDIKTTVSKSIEQGTSREKLADLLRQTQNFSRYRAETVARTEAANAQNNGDWAGQQALGIYGPTHKYWVATFDNRARPEHIAINNRTVPMSQPFLVGGEEMMFPHSPGASARNVVNCRCRALYLYPGDMNPETGEIIGEQVLGNQPTPQIRRTDFDVNSSDLLNQKRVKQFASDTYDYVDTPTGYRARVTDIDIDEGALIEGEIIDANGTKIGNFLRAIDGETVDHVEFVIDRAQDRKSVV